MTEENSDQIKETQEVVQEANMEPVEQEPVEQEPVEQKRARGRPKGALGKKTKQEQESLDVSEPKPKPIRKPRAKKIQEEPLSPIVEEPIPKPKRKVAMKKQLEAPPPPEEPMTYLEVLTRGLRAAESQHKARKVATYDNFFRY